MRLAVASVLVVLVAVVVVPGAAALRFNDESYLTPQGMVGTPYAHRFTAPPAGGGGAGCDPPYIVTVDSGALPPGLSLATDGWVRGTPTQAGSWSFWVSIRDDPSDKPWCNPMSAEREFTIKVIDRLVIGPESAAPGTVGVPYTLPMIATLSEPKTWSVSQGQLPPGLTLATSTGLISGTPASAGTYSFTVLAVVDPKRSDTKALTIVVRDPLATQSTAPFDATRGARGEVGVSFRATLAVTGGSGTYAWSLAGGALPPGVTLANGTISGKPTASGVYPFVAAVTDTESRVTNYSGRISVAERLAISTLRVRPGKVGRPYRARVVTSGGIEPASWRVVRGSLPRGLRLDRARGVVSGVPTRAGVQRVMLEVADSLGATARRTLTIVVAAQPKPRSG